MKIRKWQAVLTATIATMTLSGPAMAEHKCSAQIEQLRDGLVQRLSCNKTWDDDPIWQFQGGKGKNKDVDTDGCSIHEKLSALIYEKRTEEPPKLGGKKGKGNNLAKGAVNDLIDHKFQSAIDQLQRFQDTIEYDAVLNPDPDFSAEGHTAEEWAYWFWNWANTVRMQIDPVTGC